MHDENIFERITNFGWDRKFYANKLCVSVCVLGREWEWLRWEDDE